MSKPLTLPPVRPNPALEARFRKRLLNLIREMNASIIYWLSKQFEETPPALTEEIEDANYAADASPATELQRTMSELSKRWRSRFDEAANDLAEYYAEEIAERSDARLRAILKKAGFSVKFRMTKVQRDIIAATVHENFSLIKSIPAKYLTDLEGSVMRSVQTGRDLGK